MSPGTKTSARRSAGRPSDGPDVRGAILAATLRQLEATPTLDAVTVATIVGEAGCTPPSLYHYWPNRRLLLIEAGETGWARFRASQTAEADHPDPVERLRGRGRAYLDFALLKPALFRLLFLEPRPTPAGGPELEPGNALQELITDVTAAIAAGQLPPADPLTVALTLWSAIHGVAALWTVNPDLPTPLAHVVGDLARDSVLRGLTTAHDPR